MPSSYSCWHFSPYECNPCFSSLLNQSHPATSNMNEVKLSSGLDSDSRLSPVSSLSIVSARDSLAIVLDLARHPWTSIVLLCLPSTTSAIVLGSRCRCSHTWLCCWFSIGSIGELVCSASALWRASASFGKTCGSTGRSLVICFWHPWFILPGWKGRRRRHHIPRATDGEACVPASWLVVVDIEIDLSWLCQVATEVR